MKSFSPALWWRQLAALRLGPVALCRRLSFDGWEHLHAVAEEGRGILYLIPPAGNRLARRVLEAFRPAAAVFSEGVEGSKERLAEGAELAVVLAPGGDVARDVVRLALASGAAAVWVLLASAPRGRFTVRFATPVVPAGDDTAESLGERYRKALEDTGWEDAE